MIRNLLCRLSMVTLLLCSNALHAAEKSTVPQEGLTVWLDATDASTLELRENNVIAWKSKAGSDDAVFRANEERRQPVYVVDESGKIRPSVRFDGINDVLRAVELDQAAEEWTLCIVLTPFTGKMGGLFSGVPTGGNDFEPGFTVDLYNSTNEFNSISVEGAGRKEGQMDLLNTASPYGRMHTLVVVRSKESVHVRLDGHDEGSRAMAQAPTVFNELRLGARFYAGMERQYYTGEISELLFYNKALSPSELAALDAAFKPSSQEQKATEERTQLALSTIRPAIRMAAGKVVKSWPDVAAWQSSPEAADTNGAKAGKTAGLPIRTDVAEALALAVQHMNSLFDKDLDGEPYFFSNCQIDGTGKMLHSVNIGIPHVVGRCLLGSLIAEDLAGIIPPPDGIDTLEKYLQIAFDDPNNMNSYIDPKRENKRYVELHNVREGLYGLVYLYKMRQREWAKAKADEMIKTMASFTDAEGVWSPELAAKLGPKDRFEGMSIMNAARAVDPLLDWYKLTENPEALRLAGLYAHQGLITGFDKKGHFTEMSRSSGHVHSITSSLSGITAYAIEAKDAKMLAQCELILKQGIPEYFSSWGWGDEVTPEHPADMIGRGEINQTGDVIKTALRLGDVLDTDYYDYADRFMRSMILPTQHREEELSRFLHDKPNPKDDSETNVLQRTIGGFAMQLPNDRMHEGDWPLSTLDITSGAADSMSEFIHRILRSTPEASTLNLLFTTQDEKFRIFSHYPTEGRVSFLSLGGQVLKVRIPSFVDAKSVKLIVNRESTEVMMDKGYVVISNLEAGVQGEVTFDVPCRVEKETVDDTEYTTTWIGDQIVQIEPRGVVSPLPF